MPTITPVDLVATNELPTSCAGFRWSGLATGDVGQPVQLLAFNDKCVQMYGGTWGGATLTMQGSLDKRADPSDPNFASAVWFTLTDPQANNIAKTADSAEQIVENATWIRPSLSGGTATGIVVTIAAKRTS